jgi:TRAP-type C4-dicarboxylate transport system substrate-binding protein
MKKRHVLAGAALASAVLLLPDRAVQAEAAHVVNFGTMAPTGTPWSDQLEDIKARVQKESGGRIQVKLFLGGSLGGEIEMLKDVQGGDRLQGGGFSTGAMGEALDVPELTMIELPYLFKSTAEADAVLDDVLYQPVSDALSKKGITFYAWAENGWRNMGTKGDAPPTSPEVLAKYKMRSQESPVHIDMWKALGVQAVPKPTTEVLPALKTGIVDGYDNSPLFSLAGGLIEPISHYTLTQHIYQPAAVVYSKKFTDFLPDDLRAVVMKNAKEEGIRGRKGVRELEAELIGTIESMGVKVVTPTEEQTKVFRQTTRPVHKQFLAANPEMVGLYKEVRTKLDGMR